MLQRLVPGVALAYNLRMRRTWLSGWFLLAAWAASACGGDDATYELTLTPTDVSLSPPDGFTIRALTRFSGTPPIYLTQVVVTAEPSAIVTTLSSSNITFDDDATQTSFDPGPPPSYTFKPLDPDQGYSIQTIDFNCLSSGSAVLAFDATWTGGEPEDPSPTVVDRHGEVQVTCN